MCFLNIVYPYQSTSMSGEEEILRSIDQRFLNAAHQLFLHRKDRRVPNVLRALTGHDPWLSLLAPEQVGGTTVHLCPSLDYSETRDRIYNTVHADGYTGRILLEMAKIYEPEGMALHVVFVKGMSLNVLYDFYGNSEMVLRVWDDDIATINLGRLWRVSRLHLTAPNATVRIDDVRQWVEFHGTTEAASQCLDINSKIEPGDHLEAIKRLVRSTVGVALDNRNPAFSLDVDFEIAINIASIAASVQYVASQVWPDCRVRSNANDIVKLTKRATTNVPLRSLTFAFLSNGCSISIRSRPSENFHLVANPGQHWDWKPEQSRRLGP